MLESRALLEALDDPSIAFSDDEQRDDICAVLYRSIYVCGNFIERNSITRASMLLAGEGESAIREVGPNRSRFLNTLNVLK